MEFTPLACRTAALIVASLVAVPLGAAAQSKFVCWPIAPGDTAWSLATRHTGAAAAAYSDRFQIRDPARDVFVPKSHYDRLRTDWHACVASEVVKSSALVLTLPEPRRRQPPTSARASVQTDVAVRVGLAVSLMLFACTMAVRFVPPRPVPPHLQRAGEAFIGAFARPLIDPGAGAPPILARMRFVRHGDQLEIYLAPNDGRRYPNLADHKKNVEYDVHRVLRLLEQRVAISSPLRAEGKWVVVPIRLADPKQAGT